MPKLLIPRWLYSTIAAGAEAANYSYSNLRRSAWTPVEVYGAGLSATWGAFWDATRGRYYNPGTIAQAFADRTVRRPVSAYSNPYAYVQNWTPTPVNQASPQTTRQQSQQPTYRSYSSLKSASKSREYVAPYQQVGSQPTYQQWYQQAYQQPPTQQAQPPQQTQPPPARTPKYQGASVYHGRVPEALKRGPRWEKEHNRWVQERRRARFQGKKNKE